MQMVTNQDFTHENTFHTFRNNHDFIATVYRCDRLCLLLQTKRITLVIARLRRFELCYGSMPSQSLVIGKGYIFIPHCDWWKSFLVGIKGKLITDIHTRTQTHAELQRK